MFINFFTDLFYQTFFYRLKLIFFFTISYVEKWKKNCFLFLQIFFLLTIVRGPGWIFVRKWHPGGRRSGWWWAGYNAGRTTSQDQWEWCHWTSGTSGSSSRANNETWEITIAQRVLFARHFEPAITGRLQWVVYSPLRLFLLLSRLLASPTIPILMFLKKKKKKKNQKN